MQTESNNQPAKENQFAEALGIGTKRENALCDIIGKAYDETDTYPLAIERISEQVNNKNELAYCLFHLGAFAGSEVTKRNMMRFIDGHAAEIKELHKSYAELNGKVNGLEKELGE